MRGERFFRRFFGTGTMISTRAPRFRASITGCDGSLIQERNRRLYHPHVAAADAIDKTETSTEALAATPWAAL